MKIFLESKQDVEKLKKLCNKHEGLEQELKLSSKIYDEEESFAVICWSLEDFELYFPEHASKEAKIKGIRKIENGLKKSTKSAGWEAIDVLKDLGLQEFVEEKEYDYEY
jgi:hypothetical protein